VLRKEYAKKSLPAIKILLHKLNSSLKMQIQIPESRDTNAVDFTILGSYFIQGELAAFGFRLLL